MDGLSDALQLMKYSSAVDVIDEALALNPAATMPDVRQYAFSKRKEAEAQVRETEARIKRAVCRHCGVEITQGSDGDWCHGRTLSWGSRGCRSYSYQRLGCWDGTLDRRWTATPA
jgi:hypothetical protein